jgi:hypothetical protein
MRNVLLLPFLGAAALVSGCGETTGPEPTANQSVTAALSIASLSSEAIPVTFVTEFRDFLGGEFSPHGASGRLRGLIGLAFSVQEGDLSGTMVTWIAVNEASPQTASQGPNGIFNTTTGVQTDYDVCLPARGWCGTFTAVPGPGKVYPQPRGVEIPNAVAFGAGDFEGMKLQGTVMECADSQGNRGCFTGQLLVPANP